MRARILLVVLSALIAVLIFRLRSAPEPIQSSVPAATMVPVQYAQPAKTMEKQIPSEWERHKLNGQEYYIVPLTKK